MAFATLGERGFGRKPSTTTLNTLNADGTALDYCPLPGLLRPDVITADDQVTIFSVIDTTGSAPLEDIIAALPDHPAPAGAALALVEMGALSIESGIIDGNIRLCRANTPPDDGAAAGGSNGDDGNPPSRPGLAGDQQSSPVPQGKKVSEIVMSGHLPALFCAAGTDRAQLKSETILARPGIYIGLWSGKQGERHKAYVGASHSVDLRAANGSPLVTPCPADLIIAIVDRNDQLSWTDAKVAERLMFQLLERHGDLEMRHDTPKGASVDMRNYTRINGFVDQAFEAVIASGVLSPRSDSSISENREPAEPAMPEATTLSSHSASRPSKPLVGVTAHRAIAQTPFTSETANARLYSTQARYHLDACGVKARARIIDGRWTVLAGSQVRTRVMPSASPSAQQRRVELLHSGSLVKRGPDYVVTRDLPFSSAAAAAHFVVGCKTRPNIWQLFDTAPEAMPPSP